MIFKNFRGTSPSGLEKEVRSLDIRALVCLGDTTEEMLLDEIGDEALQRAERFFRNDYHDRGMVKWQGYFLSDHTEDVGNYTRQRERERQRQDKTEMTIEAISEKLLLAYDKCLPVTIQLRNHTETGISSPFYYGRVAGVVGDDLRLEGVAGSLSITDILWLELAP